MAAHEQDLEDQDSQAESVVIHRADHVQRAPLELRRDVGGDADPAEELPAAGLDLEAVAIDQADRRLPGDQRVAMVDVPYQVPVLVDHGEGPGEVGRGMEQEPPGGVGERAEPALRAVKVVDLLVPGDLRHDQADDLAAGPAMAGVHRPGAYPEQRLGLQPRHRPQLLGVLPRQRLVVELGDPLAVRGQLVDLPLAAPAEEAAQDQGPALAIVDRRRGFQGRRVARIRVLSSSVRSLTGGEERYAASLPESDSAASPSAARTAANRERKKGGCAVRVW